MISRENYYERIKGVDFTGLDADMNAMKEQIDKITFNGTDWTAYEADQGVKEAFDMYFKALELDLNELKPEKTNKIEDATQTYKKELKALSLKHLNYDIVEQLDPHDRAMYAKTYTPKELLEYFSSINHVELVVPFENKKTSDKTTNSDKPTFVGYKRKVLEFLVGKGAERVEAARKIQEMSVFVKTEWEYDGSIEETAKEILRNIKPTEKKVKSNEKAKKVTPKKQPEVSSKKVELLSQELKFLKSFIRMDGNNKTRHQIRLFINRIQKAIQEKRITKTSKYAKQIMTIQEKLIAFHGRFKNDKQELPVVFNEKTKTTFLKLIAEETEFISVKFIKSYINLQGKLIANKKATNLYKRIDRAIKKGQLDKRDKYWEQVEKILDHLETFVKKNPNEGILKVEKRSLNGLNGILLGCGCEEPLNGVSLEIPNRLDIDYLTTKYVEGTRAVKDNRFMMCSEDLMEVSFNHVGLKDKWFDFIGDPEVGFRLATFGRPKMGKSYLMIEFAGHLAANHGRVLYIAKEEGKSATLKKKLKDTAATHPNFMVSNYIPDNLDEFSYVFYDSVTKLGLTPANLMAINAAYPDTASIEIHQVTKDGKARGLNDFVHDVDSIINVYEKGKARQDGRFNQGAELDFFDEDAA